jgi:hypothetical protein
MVMRRIGAEETAEDVESAVASGDESVTALALVTARAEVERAETAHE